MKKNRLLWLLVIFCLLLPTVQVPVFTADDTGSAFQMEFEFLKKLNIVSDQLNVTTEVSRGTFASLISKMLYPGVDLSMAGDTNASAPFADVNNTSVSYQAIRLLRELGVVSGDSKSKFRPDDNITYEEAVAMLIKALGYAVYAEEKGGYPSGYLMIANEAGITKAVTKNTASITGDVAVKLLYNSLFADMVSIISIENGGSTSQIIRDKNLLSERLGISEYDAVVIDDGFSTLDGNTSVGDEKAVIKEYKTDAKLVVDDPSHELADYLGYRIKLFLRRDKQSDQTEIVYCAAHINTKVTMINGDRIISAADDYIEYETEKNADRYQKIKLPSNRPYVLFNGLKKAAYEAKELKPKNGFITCIDNDSDGISEIIRVVDFAYHIVVDKLDAQQEMLFCKLNPQNNFDYSDHSNLNYRVFKDSKLISIGTLQEYDVVAAAKSEIGPEGKTLYTLFVSSQSVKDSVASISQNENEVILKQKGAFAVSPYYLSLRPKLLAQLGFDGEMTFRFDYTGKIAFIDKLSFQGKNYAYLIDMKQESGLNDDIIVKFYDSAEQIIKELPLSSKVKIDEKKPDAGNLMESVQTLLCTRPDGSVTIPQKTVTDRQKKSFTNFVPRPAILTINGQNQITSIDTDAVTHGEPAVEAEDGNALKAGIRNVKDQTFNKNAGTFDGGYYLNNDTVILKVPDVDRYNLDACIQRYVPTWKYSELQTNQFEMELYDPANYKKLSLSDLNPNMNYDAQAFNVDPKTGIAELLVIRGRYEYFYHKNNYQAPFCVYLRMADYVDINTKQIMKKLYYFEGGETKSAIIDSDHLHPMYSNIIFGGKVPSSITYTGKLEEPETTKWLDVEALKEGDMISLETTDGVLTHIQRDINLSKINQKSVASYRPSAPRYPYSNGAYSATAVDIPFDQRVASSYSYGETYNLSLGVAMDMMGSSILLRQPAKIGSGMGTLSDYFGNESMTVWDKYVNLKDVKVTVIEEVSDGEKKCDMENDSCKIKVRAGSTADIRTANSFAGNPATDGFYQASRIYALSRYGVFSEIVILNLDEHHNRTK